MLVRKVQYLLALAREGHFARAAAACHVSQPTLSAGIKQLEAELGVAIVKRGQRFSGLTPEGERVLAWAQRMSIECERLHQDLQELGAGSVGTLHIGVIPSALPLIPAVTMPFQRQHPKASLRVSALNAFEIHRGLEEFTLDVAITYLDDKARHVRTRELYVEDYVLLLRKGHRFAGRAALSWAEVATLPLCLLSQEMLCPHLALTDLVRQPGQEAPVIETNSITALYAHLRAGPWASVLPVSLVQGDGAPATDGVEFDAIRLPEDGGREAVGVAMSDRTPTPLAQAFFEMASSPALAAAFPHARVTS
jgi:DNA-binding transcriptional LysR family regulator